jgi:hypothetical protein
MTRISLIARIKKGAEGAFLFPLLLRGGGGIL